MRIQSVIARKGKIEILQLSGGEPTLHPEFFELVEIGFQLLAIVTLWIMRKKSILPGQHFHLYLIAYGIFRFLHELLRATPKPFLELSGYQIVALALAFAASIAFTKRRRAGNPALISEYLLGTDERGNAED